MSHYSKNTAYLLCLLTLFHAPSAWTASLQFNSGDRQAILIELYTSQGCNSCPPAERWLGSLQQDPRLWKELIPVAFHVDYWDYLGWKDQFAKPAFSERQRRYKQEGGLGIVYTPGFVVNGREWRRWFGLNTIPDSDTNAGELTLELDGNRLHARYQSPVAQKQALVLNVALLGAGLVADIKHGENAGRRLPQDFSVLEYLQWRASDGKWSGELPQIHPENGTRLAIAAWVSSVDRLAPLQAVGGWLPVE